MANQSRSLTHEDGDVALLEAAAVAKQSHAPRGDLAVRTDCERVLVARGHVDDACIAAQGTQNEFD
eukprot:2833823-Prymnesium_polylepis.2